MQYEGCSVCVLRFNIINSYKSCGEYYISEHARTLDKRPNKQQKQTLSVCEPLTQTTHSIQCSKAIDQESVDEQRKFKEYNHIRDHL